MRTTVGQSRRTAPLVASALVVVATATGCGQSSAPARAARAYLSAWASGDDAKAAATTDDPASAERALAAARRDLRVTRVVARAGKQRTEKASTVVGFRASLTLAGLGAWSYDGRLAMRKVSGRWRVHWEPADLHPRLTAATRLAVTRTLPDRAPILDGAGQPLFAATPVVDVGVEPARLAGKDAAATYAALARVLHIDAAGLAKRVAAAQPHAFVPVVTLRRPAYDAVRTQIHDLPGTVFVEGTRLLPPTTDFGRALLGRVGEATAEVLTRAGAGYRAGDQLGVGGLEEAFQRRLAGTASGTVDILTAAGDSVTTLTRFAGSAGTAVKTTLDPRLQQAADAALKTLAKPAALVAVRPSDGAVLAVANAPSDSTYDRALAGRYPPGSTFKIVTAYALLGNGLRATTSVPCPATALIGGKEFRNFEGEARGAATLAEDFAISCNTAFAGAAARLPDDALPDAAAGFGFGTTWGLPVTGFAGAVPRPRDTVEKAATAIGQARVEASVLGMALAAAAVQSGTWRPPLLVTDPPQQQSSAPKPLDPARLGALRAWMTSVVTSGTAATAGLPAGVAGKTGTAEFGTGNPPQTHAWFVGYRGDLAVAVLVEGGGVGGRVAAPLAAAFLRDAQRATG